MFQAGEEPAEMFLLVQGRITIVFADGEEVDCSPAGIVGELGILTGERRTATVTTASECILLTFRREELDALFATDPGLRIHVLTNLIRQLAAAIRNDHEVLEGLRRMRSSEAL